MDIYKTRRKGPISFTIITLDVALPMAPADLSGVINGIPVNPAEPPARDIPDEERSAEELMLWWRQPYLVWHQSGHWVIRCLDGGAWDRSSVLGQHPELGSALELAMQPTRAYAIAARQALENGAVLMTLLGRE